MRAAISSGPTVVNPWFSGEPPKKGGLASRSKFRGRTGGLPGAATSVWTAKPPPPPTFGLGQVEFM